MDTGELLTRTTIWIAILAYAAGSVVFALSRRRLEWDSATRVIWTIGCLSLFAHFVCAYHFYHGWSHDSAYLDTARQTKEVIGLNWGGGLFINYAFLTIWIVDIAWWWLGGVRSYRTRPWALVLAWHCFLIFIIFNATVVFKHGMVRWVGLAISICLCVAWIVIARGRSTFVATDYRE